ncbi:MAG: class I SAM-dependent methyltransferase [Pseudomonadota bacterium]
MDKKPINVKDDDPSTGYDAVSNAFMAARSDVGAARVMAWAEELGSGATVLDIGAGHGSPLTPPLLTAGLRVWAIEPSPRLAATHRSAFPDIPVACEPIQDSTFFDRSFDAALMIGVIFLFTEDQQRQTFRHISLALRPGGQLLFSAPWQTGSWEDVLTKRPSLSLGRDAYTALLQEAGYRLIAEHDDEGGNHYYQAALGS